MKRAVKKSANKEPNVGYEIRRLGVLVEAGNDKWDLVAEQYGDISKKLDDHAKILNTHTEMFGTIFVDLSIIKEDIEFIKSGLKKKIDIDEFTALEKRVAFLERKVT